MRSQFPAFNLEDKIDVSEGSIDRNHMTEENYDEAIIDNRSHGPRVWRVCSRRGKRVTTQ
jgi:hypothetical protein